jgi:signal peptidase I
MEGKAKRKLATGFGAGLLFMLAFALFFQFHFTTVVVTGESMEPTFRSGQRLLVCRAYWLVGPIRRNDIVVLRSQERETEYLIKRVDRMPGEVVDFLNVPTTWKIVQGELRVPEGHLYVIGDNREASEDSRNFGPVPIDRVVGKVIVWR